MTNVPEHHTEEERERHDCEQPWVHFFVTRHAIRVDNLLEHSFEFIRLEVRWRRRKDGLTNGALHDLKSTAWEVYVQRT